MITRLIDDIKKTPSRLNERREQFSAKGREFTQKARVQLKTAAGDSSERLWSLRAQTLERVDAALDRTDDVPVVGTISKGAHKLVSTRLEALTSVPVEGYADLNARDAIAAIKSLNARVALAAVRRHESQNKARKTVLAAIEARVEALPAV